MEREQILQRLNELKQKKAQLSQGSGFGGVIVQPKVPGLEITDLDAMKRIEQAKAESKLMYPSASEKKELAEKDQYSNRINSMVELFDRAYPVSRQGTFGAKMGTRFPKFGQTAMDDKLIGAEVAIKKATGSYPENQPGKPGWDDIMAYEDLSDGFLTTLAKQAGEQRPTDADVRRFRKSLMGFGKTSGRNEILKKMLQQDSQTLSPKQFLYKYTGNEAYRDQ